MSTLQFSRAEGNAIASLAVIFALRMFGLFMIYPAFALYARGLPDATPFRIGFALGIYGLAQALLQIPLGLLSDRVGRKPVIALGLLVFASGSVVAATAHTVAGIGCGRLLQGAGAVGSAILALAADLTSERNRTAAMAAIGMSIGVAFALALVTGPMLDGWVGVPGMFWLTALLGIGAILLLYGGVPHAPPPAVHAEAEAVPALLGRVLRNPQLLLLDFGILAQHAILTATFLGVPLALRRAGVPEARDWPWYLGALLVSLVFMVPMIIQAERRGRTRPLLLLSIALIGGAQLAFLGAARGIGFLGLGLTLFFIGFNFLEAALPASISKRAPADVRGTAMGIYSGAQFLGIFLGGVLGGWSQNRYGASGGFVFSLVVAAFWMVASWRLRVSAGPKRAGLK